MTLLGGAFLFPEGATVMLAGADFAASLDGAPVPLWGALQVPPGGVLRIGPTRGGARCYLAVHGGIAVEPFLGSASSHVLSGLGGFEGRALRATDVPQSDWFAEASRNIFYTGVYLVSEEANRMGLRLQGAPTAVRYGHMITEGVPLGAIQVAASGPPIILFVEQQTTGGYPKIVNVIAAGLASVGQLSPRVEVRFERVDLTIARSLLREQEELIREVH